MGLCPYTHFSSLAVGMATARPNGFKIDFVRNLISRLASRFFFIILKIIFKTIYENKIPGKKILATKIISFAKAD